MIGKIKDFQKDIQEAVLPDFMKQGELSARKREPVVMDAKWWCVNIAIACAPALLIQLVCMYKQDDMIEFYKHQQLLQNGGVQSGIQSRNMGNGSDAIVQPTDDSSWETTKSKSVLDAAAALFGFKNVVQDENDDCDTNETRLAEEEISTTHTKIDEERNKDQISDPKSYSQLLDKINSLEQQIKELKGDLSVQHDDMVVNTNGGQDSNENVTPVTEDVSENKVEVRTVTADSMKDFFSSQVEQRKDAIIDTAKDALVQIQQTLIGNSANDEQVKSDTDEINTMEQVLEINIVSDDSKPYVVATQEVSESNDDSNINDDDSTHPKDKTKRWYHRLNVFRSKQNKR